MPLAADMHGCVHGWVYDKERACNKGEGAQHMREPERASEREVEGWEVCAR